MLDEMKGFKDRITVKVLLSNYKVNTDRENLLLFILILLLKH